MTKPPDLIYRFDDTPLYGEPQRLSVPVISVVDSDTSMSDIDYPVPANTKSLRFYHTLACMLVRAANEGTMLRTELRYNANAALNVVDEAGSGERPQQLRWSRGAGMGGGEGRGGGATSRDGARADHSGRGSGGARGDSEVRART